MEAEKGPWDCPRRRGQETRQELCLPGACWQLPDSRQELNHVPHPSGLMLQKEAGPSSPRKDFALPEMSAVASTVAGDHRGFFLSFFKNF